MFDCRLPILLLFTTEFFEGIYHCFGYVPRLQVLCQDGCVVLEPLQVVAFDGTDALQHFAGVEHGSGVVKGLEVLAGGLRSTKVRVSGRTRKRMRLVPGTWRSTSPSS